MTRVQPASSPSPAAAPATVPPTAPGTSDSSILVFDQESNRLLGLVDNLDGRGFRLKGHQPIALYERFQIRFEAPAALLPPLLLNVMGRWSEITIESGIFLSLMDFEELSDEATEALADFRAL